MITTSSSRVRASRDAYDVRSRRLAMSGSIPVKVIYDVEVANVLTTFE
jgi:hypothetical protein